MMMIQPVVGGSGDGWVILLLVLLFEKRVNIDACWLGVGQVGLSETTVFQIHTFSAAPNGSGSETPGILSSRFPTRATACAGARLGERRQSTSHLTSG